MRILTPEQSARVIGGASTVTTCTLAADQLRDARSDDQEADGVVVGPIPPDTRLSPYPANSAR
jgi:hypothetical protein